MASFMKNKKKTFVSNFVNKILNKNRNIQPNSVLIFPFVFIPPS